MTNPPLESRWLAWGRTTFAATVVVILAALGIMNIALRARLHEVEDGVLWSLGSAGVTASAVAPASAGTAAGITSGDVLLSVNGRPVHKPEDVVEYQHQGHAGTLLRYGLQRQGSRLTTEVSLAPAAALGSLYFVLAGVGMFSLFVGASVRLRRPRDQATLHFFWLSVAFFGAFTFSFNGPFDRLDWVFYWGDAVAMALLPPLLLHFTLVFPERSMWRAPARASWGVVALYVPAFSMILLRIAAVARGPGDDGAFFSLVLDRLDRAEPIYLFSCAVGAVLVFVKAFGQIQSRTGRRQLRWIAWGTALGVGPFACGYALPWALGLEPPLALQLTAVPLGLVPLAFASAIVRYRLRDVEVIIKRGLVYTAFFGASVALYLAIRRLASFAFGNDDDPRNWIVAFLATGVIVLLARPVKDTIQDALDRVFYRDRYDYRRALVGFARDLNTDLDVVRLSQRLVTRVVETLVVDRMALLLADDRLGDFRTIGDYGFAQAAPELARDSSFMARLNRGDAVALDDPIAAARFVAEEVEFWRDQGIYYFVPCAFEGAAIAVMALGRKSSDEPFNSEDLALLTAVAGQVATAIENGRLYRQLHLKADELGRMREFNDNILESLDDGLVVFDEQEVIVRWNRALEQILGTTREAAVGRHLADVFEPAFVEALRAARSDHPSGAATLFRIPLRTARDSGGGADGNRLLVNATVVPLQGTDLAEAAAGSILLLNDVSRRVRLEEQLQISEKMASLGLLAAGVAHEVNTPLTGISSFTQMLLEGADRSDPRTAMLEKIEKQTFRAAKIVNSLLNLSRPGTPGGERSTVDLNDVIGDVLGLLEHQFAASSIKVRRELSPAPVNVKGIEHQLQQVFLNLFLNARDAMPKGGWLTVTTRAAGGRVAADVSDTGVGIPPEHVARIYDPFFTTKAIGRGTGLGLSITYGIVQEHGGTIRCDSAAGQGTRFTMTLPQAPVGAAARRVEA
jgi:two-component system NtrC family sensor kinase